MINLTQDTNDSFGEYKAAVDRKNDDSIEKITPKKAKNSRMMLLF